MIRRDRIHAPFGSCTSLSRSSFIVFRLGDVDVDGLPVGRSVIYVHRPVGGPPDPPCPEKESVIPHAVFLIDSGTNDDILGCAIDGQPKIHGPSSQSSRRPRMAAP